MGAYFQKNLCKSYDNMPPYVCTRTQLIKPNGFLASVSLAFSQASLFFGILIGVFSFVINWNLPDDKNKKALKGSEDNGSTREDTAPPGVSGQTPMEVSP